MLAFGPLNFPRNARYRSTGTGENHFECFVVATVSRNETDFFFSNINDNYIHNLGRGRENFSSAIVYSQLVVQLCISVSIA